MNKKRLTALFTVITMLICTLAIQATSFAYKESVSDEAVVEFIKSLEIINTDIDEIDNKVSRENFAVYVAKMLKGNEYDAEVRYFVDVEKTAYSFKSINYLVDLGVISVGDEHLFRPGDNVTYDEAIKMIVCALGGGSYGQLLGGYPFGYHKAAQKLDLQTQHTANDYITTGEAISLIYNALIANTYDKYDDGDTAFSTSGVSILNSVWNIYYGEGTVNAVYGASLGEREIENKNEIYIGDNMYTADGISADIYELFGSYVRFYYTKEAGYNTARLNFLCEDVTKETVKTEIADFEAYSKGKLVFSDEKDKKVEYNIINPVVIYNGKELGTDIADTMDNLNKGYISIKDSDNDGSYDTMIIWDYDNFYVGSVSGDIMYNRYNTTDKISIDEVDAITIRNGMNEEIPFSDIAKGNVLSAARSKDGKYVLIYNASNTLTAKITSMNENNGKYVINDVTYEAEPSYKERLAKEVNLAEIYNIVIDMFGYICSVSIGSADAALIPGFLIAITETDGFSKNVKMKLLTTSGEIAIGQTIDNIRIDGRKYKNSTDAINHLNTYGINKVIAYSAQTVEKAENTPESNNNELIIAGIDTIYVDEEAGETKEESLCAVWNDNFTISKWYMSGNLGRKAVLRTNSTVFMVPMNENSKGQDDSYYTSTVGSTMTNDGSYKADVYKLKGKNGYGDVVLEGYDSVQLTTNKPYNKEVMVYLRDFEQEDSEGDVKQYVEVQTLSGKVSYPVDDGYIDFSAVEPGDIIDFEFDKNKKILKGDGVGYTTVYDYDKPISDQTQGNKKWGHAAKVGEEDYLLYNYIKGDGDRYDYSNGYRRDFQFSYGRPIRIFEDGVMSLAASDTDNRETEYLNTSGIKVIVIEPGRDDAVIRDGSIGDIISFEDAGEKCSKIIYYTRVGIGRAIVVYNF